MKKIFLEVENKNLDNIIEILNINDIVNILIDKGFQLVTVSQLYDLKGIELKAGEVYYNIK